MVLNIEAIIWYLFILDAIGANIAVLFLKKWWNKKKLSKYIPLKGFWTLVYFLVSRAYFSAIAIGLT